MKALALFIITGFAVLLAPMANAQNGWPNRHDWPQTDFSKFSIPASEFTPGGPRKDGIRAIERPQFKSISDVSYRGREPVIALEVDGVAKAYPLSILMWHEIANDTIAGRPVAVTFCPLCNAAIVYERTVDGVETTFGVTGILRKSDLVMYDRGHTKLVATIYQ